MALSTDETACLVAALLTVNLYPLDQAHALMPAFRARGLLDPEKVAVMPQEALISALSDAGYSRGGYLPIVSFRLYTLLETVASGGLDALREHAARQDRDAFIRLLTNIKGFGPATAAAAWELWRA